MEAVGSTRRWSHSSAGQSVRLITVRSAAQARVGPCALVSYRRARHVAPPAYTHCVPTRPRAYDARDRDCRTTCAYKHAMIVSMARGVHPHPAAMMCIGNRARVRAPAPPPRLAPPPQSRAQRHEPLVHTVAATVAPTAHTIAPLVLHVHAATHARVGVVLVVTSREIAILYICLTGRCQSRNIRHIHHTPRDRYLRSRAARAAPAAQSLCRLCSLLRII